MDIKPFKKIICRTPAFDMDATLEENYATLKDRIALSSPVFFILINKLEVEELKTADQKIRFTLWKYFNRSRFRCTPYATFAAISIVESERNPEQLILEESMTSIRHLDWSEKAMFFKEVRKDRRPNLFLRNSSVYFSSGQARFIRSIESKFHLTSVQSTPEIKAILILCRNPTRLDDLLKFLYDCFNMDQSTSRSLLAEMESLQLLTNDNWPNIIGKDYFSRLGCKVDPAPSDYIIATRERLSGGIDERLVTGMKEYIQFVSKYKQSQVSDELLQFKTSFIRKFEGQAISLARAMDPEIGIGYGNLEQAFPTSHLISLLKTEKNDQLSPSITEYSDLHIFLLKKLVLGQEIKLQEMPVQTTKVSAKIPNTFSIVFEIYDGTPVVKVAGGTSANGLLGRFTFANDSLSELANEIADIEQSANPETLFFDVGYQTQQRIDNVNRRKKVYPLELSILGWNEDQLVLDMEDIMVAVENKQVVLFSQKFGKRLIPRIPSAYNSVHSDLGIFRFLSDIQHQDLLTDINIHIKDIFPNLENYPRISYKKLIISPQTWLFPNEKEMDAKDVALWFKQKKIFQPIKAGISDQTLLFNPFKEEDMLAFYTISKQQKGSFYIEEALVGTMNNPKDQQGKTYHAQYVASFHHNSLIYGPVNITDDIPFRAKIPGSDWLYYEVEIHPASGNELLLKIHHCFLRKNKRFIKKWFFIRYTDPRPHLRLRLHLRDESHALNLTQELGKLLLPEMKSGRVSDFQLKTYKQELHRFGEEEIDPVEFIFYLDSQLFMNLLKRKPSEEQLMHNAVHYLFLMIDGCLSELKGTHMFIASMAKSFAVEAAFDHAAFKDINANFRAARGIFGPTVSHSDMYINKVGDLLAKISNQQKRERLLADFIHLHINRLFQSDQRLYEAVIYQQLLSFSKIPKKRST